MKGDVRPFPGVTPPESEIELDLGQLWTALMRRKWVIISLFLIACVTAYIASSLMTPIYEATTTLLVRDSNAGLSGLLLDGVGGPAKTELQRSVEIFKSRTLALKTAQSLGYDWDEYSPAFGTFRNSISVSTTANSDLLRISVQHEDPYEAQRIANALVETFIEQTQQMNSESVRSARQFVGEQLRKFEADLERAEEELVRYREQLAAAQQAGDSERLVTGASSSLLESVIRLESLKAEAVVAKEAAEQRLLALQGGELERRSVVSGTVIANNPIINAIRSQLVNLEAELAAAQEQYTDAHPVVVSLTARINELRSELNREIGRLELTDAEVFFSQELVNIEAEILAQTARIDALDRLIRGREALLGELPEKELHLTRLIRNATVTESIYTMLLTRYEEMRISEAMEASNVSVLDAAIAPRNPVKPRKQLNVAIAGFLGLFLGVGIAFLLEYLDTTFRDTDEMEAYLGVPVLGRVPTIAANERRERRERRTRKAG